MSRRHAFGERLSRSLQPESDAPGSLASARQARTGQEGQKQRSAWVGLSPPSTRRFPG